MWQRIHQVPRYSLILPSLKPTGQICSLKWWMIHSWHLTSNYSAEQSCPLSSHITYPFPKQMKMSLNIFKDGSRLSLPSLLPQSLASKTNVNNSCHCSSEKDFANVVHENNTTFLLLDIPLLISTRIPFAALFTAPHRVCIQWVVHNPPSVLDTTAVWQKTFAFCLYLMCVLPCWTYDFAFDFAVEQALFIKQPESGSTIDSLPGRNCYSAHFVVMPTFYHRGLYIFFHIFNTATKEYWAKRKSYCESVRICTAY